MPTPAALRPLSLAILLALGGPASPAGAQETGTDKTAEALDQEHRRLERPEGSLQLDETVVGRLALASTGVQDWLERMRIGVEALLVQDSSWAAAGGRRPGDTAARGLLELLATVDSATLLGIEGGQLLVGAQVIDGPDGSARVGTLQAISNIDAEDRAQVPFVWYEQAWSDVVVRAGKMDANRQFAYVDAAGDFAQASMGFSPTILGLPTFPNPAFGVSLRVAPEGSVLGATAAVYDGSALDGLRTGSTGLPLDAEETFWIAQLDATWSGSSPGRASFGVWHHTGTFQRFDGGTEEGSAGLQWTLEQRLWNEPGVADRNLQDFLQLGLADPRVALVYAHLGAGLAWSQPFGTLGGETLGVGFSSAELTDEPGAGVDEPREIVFESYYGFEPKPWVRFRPTVQFVVAPGGDSSVDDALVLLLRSSVSL